MSGYRFMDGITEYRKDRTTEGQGESSIAPLFQSGAIISKVEPSHEKIRAVAGQRSSPDLCFATTSVKIYDP